MLVSKTSFFFFSRMTMSVEKKTTAKIHAKKKLLKHVTNTNTRQKDQKEEKKFSRKKKKSKNFESIPTKFG